MQAQHGGGEDARLVLLLMRNHWHSVYALKSVTYRKNGCTDLTSYIYIIRVDIYAYIHINAAGPSLLLRHTME